MKKCAIYVRVSTEEQKNHGLSVDAQIQALQEYAQNHGYIIAGIYNDAGISARKTYKKRPALLKLVSDCQKGLIDIIIFTKLDRWFRSVGDYYEVQKELDACHVPWRAIWEDYETETSAGVFKVNIMLSVAQSEADRTSERIKSIFEYKRQQGMYVGSVPKGYKRIDGKLVKDEETHDLVNGIFDLYLKTYSTNACLQYAIENGWSPTLATIRRILDNPAYYGELPCGQSCDPYITKEQHDIIVDSFMKRTKSTKKKRTYKFAGLLFCGECNSRMRAVPKVQNGASYVQYVCQGQKSNLKHLRYCTYSERNMESFLIENLDEILSEYNIRAKASTITGDVKKNINRKKQLESKMDRIGIRFENGDISEDEYKSKIQVIKEEIASIRFDTDVKEIEIPSNWKEIYNSLDAEHQAQFWKSIISKIVIPYNQPRIPIVFFL